MSSGVTIGECYYNADDGSVRQILFQKAQENAAKTIQAVLSAKVEEKWMEISRLDGSYISVEMASQSEKERATRARMCGRVYFIAPDVKLSNLSSEEQKMILTSLTPTGKWEVEITEGIGKSSRYRILVSLNLYIPDKKRFGAQL